MQFVLRLLCQLAFFSLTNSLYHTYRVVHQKCQSKSDAAFSRSNRYFIKLAFLSRYVCVIIQKLKHEAA